MELKTSGRFERCGSADEVTFTTARDLTTDISGNS